MSTTFSPASRGLVRVQVTISNTATLLKDIAGLSATLVNNASSALIYVRVGEINFSHAPEAPTTSAGILIPVDGSFQPIGPLVLQSIKLIRNGASDATVDIILEG